MKGRSDDGRVQYEVALWAMDWENFQAVKVVNGIPGAGNADSDISGKGVETALLFVPTENLTVQASLSYTSSELDKNDPALGGLKGEQTRFVPEWAGSLIADYSFTIGELAASVGGGIRYVGDFETSYYGPLSSGMVNSAFSVDSSTQVDLNFGIYGETLGLRLFVTNLLNEYDLANAVATGVQGLFATASGFPVRPRTIGVNLSYSF